MSTWDDASQNNAATSALYVPKNKNKNRMNNGLSAPLLPQEQEYQNNNKPYVNNNTSNNAQVRDQQAESVGSNVSDEIFYGNGKGLKLSKNYKTEEDFQRSLLEERERDIIQTTESIRKVNEVFTELGGLVESQQVNIDDIENQVSL